MIDLEQHYLKLPVSLQHIACSAQGWWIQRNRFGRGFNEQLQRARERLSWSNDRIVEYRDARGRFSFSCPQSCGSPSDGTDDGFGNNVAAVRLPISRPRALAGKSTVRSSPQVTTGPFLLKLAMASASESYDSKIASSLVVWSRSRK